MDGSQISWDELGRNVTIVLDHALQPEHEQELTRIYGVSGLQMAAPPSRRVVVIGIECHTLKQSTTDTVLTYLFTHGYLQPTRFGGADA